MPFERREQSYAESHAVTKHNKNVTRPITRIDKEIGKKKRYGGKKKKFTVTRMRNGINKYFERCEKRDEPPTIKGLMIYLKMGAQSFYDYIKYPEFTELLEHTKMIITHWFELDVYTTQGRPDGKIAYMKNIHNWTDRIETKNENIEVRLTAEQARAKIAALAPALLDILDQSPETVRQIGKEEVEEAEYVEARRV